MSAAAGRDLRWYFMQALRQPGYPVLDVSWSYGAGDPDPTRRAELAATPRGVTGAARLVSATGTPLDLSYLEISDGVRMVTQLHGVWTVYIYDRHDRLVQMEFNSLRAARLFLDAASAIARGQS
jgi:hypothetical protein